MGHESKVTGQRKQVKGHMSKVKGHRAKVTGHMSKVKGHKAKVSGHGSKYLKECHTAIGLPSDHHVKQISS